MKARYRKTGEIVTKDYPMFHTCEALCEHYKKIFENI